MAHEYTAVQDLEKLIAKSLQAQEAKYNLGRAYQQVGGAALRTHAHSSGV
jgi:hypothetical protein